jgi:hypothetical protein
MKNASPQARLTANATMLDLTPCFCYDPLLLLDLTPCFCVTPCFCDPFAQKSRLQDAFAMNQDIGCKMRRETLGKTITLTRLCVVT